MYKVFVNDKPIILTSSLEDEHDFPFLNFKNSVIQELIHKLKVGKLKGIYLICENLEEDWKSFCQHFKVLTAGGGLVLNQKKEVLFIYRGNKWDLPKGGIEKGERIEETAIREVEEECGISNVTIEKFLIKTYHIFSWKNEPRIKETYWYLMHSNYSGVLTPQLEEGITEVVFKSKQDAELALKNSYANIRLVYNSFLNE